MNNDDFTRRVRQKHGTLTLHYGDRLSGIIASIDDAAMTIDVDADSFTTAEQTAFVTALAHLRMAAESFYILAEATGGYTVDGRIAAVRGPAVEGSDGPPVL